MVAANAMVGPALLVAFPAPGKGALGGFVARDVKGLGLGAFGLQQLSPLRVGFGDHGRCFQKKVICSSRVERSGCRGPLSFELPSASKAATKSALTLSVKSVSRLILWKSVLRRPMTLIVKVRWTSDLNLA